MPKAKLVLTDLVEKIHSLPPSKIAEVEDFVDFLQQRTEDKMLSQAAMKMSEASFNEVWNNPSDSEYDNL